VVLMNVVTVFQFVALMGLPTNVVGAASGASVAFTTLLAGVFLKERIGARRLAWTAVLFVAIAASGLLGDGAGSRLKDLAPGALYLFLALPLAAGLVLIALRRRRGGPGLAQAAAAVSGCLGGFMVFPMRALQFSFDSGGLAGVLAAPYLYLLLLAGASSFALVQAAYKDGEMASVAPALYGAQLLWPALGSYFVFAAPVYPAQAAAFALAAVCVAAVSGARPFGGKR
jgi:drug/metabolite transporter (DMT)-like permease